MVRSKGAAARASFRFALVQAIPTLAAMSTGIRLYQPSDLVELKRMTVEAFDGIAIDQRVEEHLGILRWHDWRGGLRHLRALGLRGRMLQVAHSSRGAWHLARTGSLQTALSNLRLRQHGFLVPSDLATAL